MMLYQIMQVKKKEGHVITKSMINNYVKHTVIKPAINKKYNKEHIATLFVICILKTFIQYK